ncbi:glutamate receptor ionotropic, kainate 4-like [Eriocheir sinensis]|uniref:glutamate receptor ionotropic, kainate 4-like n=1 Tax=Eriocheir sinensis TaxID=95602 RepID=UPI0021C7501E|nr:glutamate receptor ionotropic, kainate 4-like [Eriocheir sinensis]
MMPVVFVVWLAVAAAVCGGSTEAGEARAAAMWWRAAGEDLVRAWARKEKAISVSLVTIAEDEEDVAAAWAGTVKATAERLTTTATADPWVCGITSLRALPRWTPNIRTLVVAPFFTQYHAHVLSQVMSSSNRQVRKWLLLSLSRLEDLLPALFLPFSNQVVVAQLGQVVELWEQYQGAPELKRHLHLRATWTPPPTLQGGGSEEEHGGLNLLQVPVRQPDLTGLHIRCLAEEWPPFIMVDTEGGKTISKISGISAEIWETLRELLNFTYSCNRSPDGEWGVLRPDGVWSGMIGELVRGAADVIVGNVDQTLQRSMVIDFAVPITTSTFRLAVRKPSSAVGGWDGYSMEFTPAAWLGLLVTACLCSLGLALVLCLAARERFAVREAVLIVLGCLCLQGPAREEYRMSGRILLLTTGVFGLLSFTHYSSVLISFLTFTRASHPITSLEDLFHSTTYTMGIFRGTSTQDLLQTSRRDLYHRVWNKLLLPRPDSFVKSNAEGVYRALTENYVFLLEESIYLYRYSSDCRLLQVGPRYLSMLSSFTFRKNLPYKQIFDQGITRILEGGVVDREIKRMQRIATCETNIIMPLRLENIFTALVILGVGILVSIILLLMEKLSMRQ